MAKVLRAMRQQVHETSTNAVNFDELNLPYRLGSQRTKMRLHGLIARLKGGDGHYVANTWLITKKGGDFLRGEAIQKTIVVFNNQLLGHEGSMVTIQRVDGEAAYKDDAISTPEAGVYGSVRKNHGHRLVKAEYLQYHRGLYDFGLVTVLEIDRLQFGKPVKVKAQLATGMYKQLEYPDIAAFQRNWKIIE